MAITFFEIGYVSADTFGTFPLNSNISLTFSCQNSTYLNISRIYVSPQSITILDQETSIPKIGNVYNYTLNSSYTIYQGTYFIYYHCDLNGNDFPTASSLIVNNSGYETTTGSSIMMFLGFIGIMILALTFFIFGNLFKTIGVRIFLYSMSILFTIFGIGYGYNVSITLVGQFANINNSLSNVYVLLTYLGIAGGIGLMVYLIYMAFNYFYSIRGFRD